MTEEKHELGKELQPLLKLWSVVLALEIGLLVVGAVAELAVRFLPELRAELQKLENIDVSIATILLCMFGVYTIIEVLVLLIRPPCAAVTDAKEGVCKAVTDAKEGVCKAVTDAKEGVCKRIALLLTHLGVALSMVAGVLVIGIVAKAGVSLFPGLKASLEGFVKTAASLAALLLCTFGAFTVAEVSLLLFQSLLAEWKAIRPAEGRQTLNAGFVALYYVAAVLAVRWLVAKIGVEPAVGCSLAAAGMLLAERNSQFWRRRTLVVFAGVLVAAVAAFTAANCIAALSRSSWVTSSIESFHRS